MNKRATPSTPEVLMMATEKTVLILGGGVGGVVAARQLRKYLTAIDRIVVIDREEKHYFAPSFLWLMLGERTPESISRPLTNLNKKGIEFIRSEIESIDPQGKSVHTKSGVFKGDAMIVALGSEYKTDSIAGLKEAGDSFYTLEGSQAIAKKLASFQKGKIVILTAAPQYKCPAAPYEAAMLIESYCKKKGIRDQVQIDFFAAEAAPMATGGPEVSAGVCQLLQARNIPYHPSHQVTEVNALRKEISFSDGTSASYDLLIYVPPQSVPKVLQGSPLVSESGWIPVNAHTLETSFKDVYAIGDVNLIPLKIGKPLPKAGVFAHGEAEVVAYNIVQKWKGKNNLKSYDGKGYCFVETGDRKAGIGIGVFFEEQPRMKLYQPNLFWHLGKILFEKYWLWKWF